MVGSLSLFSPGSIQSYGASYPAATAQSLAGGCGAACGSSDCCETGALNRASLQAQQQSGFGLPGQGGGASGTGGSRLAGGTLLTAQEAGQGSASGKSGAADELSEEEQAQVAKLKQIDAKVRAHERAHATVGGAHAGAPSYTYTRGPDGQMYATGGEVAIDISAETDPEATLQKATQVAAAALAPADPSGQDRAVAAAAAQLRLEALAQLREQKRGEQEQQEAERTEAKAAKAERDQQSGVVAPAAEAGQVPATVSGAPAGQARTQAAHRQIGQLVGLIA